MFQREFYLKMLIFVNVVIAMAFVVVAGAWSIELIDIGTVNLVIAKVHNVNVRIAVTVFATLLILADILLIKRRLFGRYISHFVIQTGGGDVRISLSAIEDSLERAAGHVPDVQSIKVYARKRRKADSPLKIRVTYAIWEESIVKDVAQRLQAAMLVRLEQIIGSEVTPEFEMAIVKIASKENRRQSQQESGGSPAIFTGPLYPIDRED